MDKPTCQTCPYLDTATPRHSYIPEVIGLCCRHAPEGKGPFGMRAGQFCGDHPQFPQFLSRREWWVLPSSIKEQA